jgi:NADPH:quinone reductase-like Zn-dependent oxidoreductase
MRAMVQDRYGTEEVLQLREIAQPSIGERDVLVRVQAASIHVGDRLLMTGVPHLMRMVTGLRRPRRATPGTDIAGTVEAVGRDVTRFAVGDAVFGWTTGAFAEFASAPEDHLAAKPSNLTFEQAAAVGVSATTALQLLRDQGRVKPGQRVLINGASGGVGTFAVQIAKASGAEVTGVTSTRNVELLRSIGADHVIDYTKDDFTKGPGRYDFILDNVGNHSLGAMRRVLTPSGVLQPNGGGHTGGGLGRIIRATITSTFVRGQGRPSTKFPNAADLVTLKGLVEDGAVTPVLDRTYPLDQTAAAIRHVGTGHARGTVVLTMAAPAPAAASAPGSVTGGATLTAVGVA